MMRIFKKLKRIFLDKGKTRSYLIYSLIEVFLIVLGVLIALQVSNWNENRQNIALEKEYLLALKNEINDNDDKLFNLIETNSNCIKHAQKLYETLTKEYINRELSDIPDLFNEIFKYNIEFNPNVGVLKNLINSGNLNILSDFELKNSLSALETRFVKIKSQEEIVRDLRIQLINRTKKSLNFIPVQRKEEEIVGFKVDISAQNSEMLKSEIEFANNILFLIATSYALNNNYYKSTRNRFDQLLNMIEKNI